MRGRTGFAVASAFVVLAAGGALTWRAQRAQRAQGGRPHDAGTVVAVTERDFQISAPAQVSPGDVRLRIRNAGPDRHELLVVRLADSAPLPFRSSGLTLDEDALESATVGILEAREPNTVNDLDVHLERGRYQLFCNMSGHYLGGMQTELDVR